ncbi:unnamed protein product [Pylaiella littoralis]
MAQLSPLQAFGKLCSLAMLTTARVGDVEEDLPMSQARPRLAAINERGLVTTDSQMGLKTIFQDVRDGSEVLHWQRSYVSRCLPRHMGAKFEERLNIVDCVSFFIGVPGHSPPYEQIYHIPVTKYVPEDLETRAPMATSPFRSIEFLPEVRTILQDTTCFDIVEQDSLKVEIADTIWGRPWWLFDKVAEILDEVLQD